MKPVTQSRVGVHGRCFPACVASILEVPEANVPGYEDTPDVYRWLAKHGLEYRQVPIEGNPAPVGYHIIEGISPRGGQHAVVGLDGKIVHDPHPQDGTGRGLVKPERWGMLLPLRGRAEDIFEPRQYKNKKTATGKASTNWHLRKICAKCGGPVSNDAKPNTWCQACLLQQRYEQRGVSLTSEQKVDVERIRRAIRRAAENELGKSKDSMLSDLALQAAITPVYTRHNEIKATPRRSWQEVSSLLGETKALLDASRISDKAKWQTVLAHASSFLAMARDAERQGDNPHFVGWTERAFMMTHHVLDVLESLARRTAARDEDKFDRQAAECVQRHNAASKEYKAAFKAVGARMWPMDNAHELKPYNQQCIAESARRTGYRQHLPRPLTVLNSYPDVTPKQRKWLNAEVDRIYQKYGGKFGRDHAKDTHWEPGGDIKRLWLEANAPYGPGDLIKLPNGKITEVTKCLLGENLFHEPEYHVSTKTGECVVVPVKARSKDRRAPARLHRALDAVLDGRK